MVWAHEKEVVLQSTIEREKLEDIEALIIILMMWLIVLDLEPHQHTSHFHHPFSFRSEKKSAKTPRCPFHSLTFTLKTFS